MSADTQGGDTPTLPPDDAFSVLGDETRMQIIQALGDADEPLSFSELHDRVEIRDSGQFNYHLDQLMNHFVTKSGDRYELQPAGRRVIEAVVAGAVTEAPIMEPTEIDEDCPMCGATTVVAFYHDQVEHYCTECAGNYDNARAKSDFATSDRSELDSTLGYIGSTRLPPAGLHGRDPNELHHAAANWLILDLLAVSSGICPRCSATLDAKIALCENHDDEDGGCRHCNNRHAIQVGASCQNCPFDQEMAASLTLLTEPSVLHYLLDQNINPISPSSPMAFTTALMNYDEDIRSIGPFEVRFTFSFEDDELTLSLDDDLNVIEARRHGKAG